MEDPSKAALKGATNSGDGLVGQTPGNNLPLVEIGLQALAMPFKHLLPLIRLGGLPFLFSLACEIIGNAIRSTGLVRSIGAFWVVLGMTVVYVPFEIGWIRLVIGGPSAVVNRSLFPFGRTERRYLLGVFLMACSVLIVVPPALGIKYAVDTFDHNLQLETVLLFLWIFVAVVVCLIRLLIVFPAIATNTYRGLTATWKQSSGHFEEIAILDSMVRLPWFVIVEIVARMAEPYSSFALRAWVIAAQCVVFLFAQATVAGMLALVYQHLTPELAVSSEGPNSAASVS
ncbi:MAG TPA: hypothetical protein VGG60_17605 [Candidatus Binataceae bacterium]|jgi:hypothetical protein